MDPIRSAYPRAFEPKVHSSVYVWKAQPLAIALGRRHAWFRKLLESNLKECERLSRIIENAKFLARSKHPHDAGLLSASSTASFVPTFAGRTNRALALRPG
ncbi:hypothetical protein [Paraburkholderia youngii]|uniref:hypothetical protein n=1 Tax=Paraburkholderia youngii TaxID=2782701 RepID=UPI003D1B2A3F